MPTAVPGQILSGGGTTVWPEKSKVQQSPDNTKCSPTTTLKSNTKSQCNWDTSNSKFNGTLEYTRCVSNYSENLINFKCNDIQNEPYLFSMEWLV